MEIIKLVTIYTWKSDIVIPMGDVKTHQTDNDFDILITCHPHPDVPNTDKQ